MNILPIIVFSYILPQDAGGTPNKKLKQLVILLKMFLYTLVILQLKKLVEI